MINIKKNVNDTKKKISGITIFKKIFEMRVLFILYMWINIKLRYMHKKLKKKPHRIQDLKVHPK